MYANSICTAQESLKCCIEKFLRETCNPLQPPIPGSHAEGWGPWNFPPTESLPPRNLELSMVIIVVPSILAIYMLLDIHVRKYVLSKCCLGSLSQIASEAI